MELRTPVNAANCSPFEVNLSRRSCDTHNSTEIDVAERIIHGTTHSYDGSAAGSSVRVFGGTTFGTCIVDRRTDLPTGCGASGIAECPDGCSRRDYGFTGKENCDDRANVSAGTELGGGDTVV